MVPGAKQVEGLVIGSSLVIGDMQVTAALSIVHNVGSVNAKVDACL